jgi:hypothetical protein
MRMAATATRQVIPSSFAERMCHIPRRTTLVTLDPKIFSLERGTALEKPESASAGRWTCMNEVMPREIVEMTVSTSQQKASGNRICVPCGLVPFRALAVFMNESSLLRPKPVFLAFEKTNVVGG